MYFIVQRLVRGHFFFDGEMIQDPLARPEPQLVAQFRFSRQPPERGGQRCLRRFPRAQSNRCGHAQPDRANREYPLAIQAFPQAMASSNATGQPSMRHFGPEWAGTKISGLRPAGRARLSRHPGNAPAVAVQVVPPARATPGNKPHPSRFPQSANEAPESPPRHLTAWGAL